MRPESSRQIRRLITLVAAALVIASACSATTDVQELDQAGSDGTSGAAASGEPDELGFSEDLPTSPLEGGATIGVSMQNVSRSFFTGLEGGARGQAAAMGATLIITDAEDDVAKQLADVAELIDAGVDGLILSPVDSGAAVEIAAMAGEAGVPLVAVANQIGTVEDFGPQYVYPGTVALVTNDDVDMGRKAADLAAELLGDDAARIAVIAGKEGTANAVMRHDGFTSGLDELSIDYEIVASTPGDWNADGGRLACEGFLADESVTMIFSMSDAMTIGCTEVLTAADRSDIDVVSIGGNSEGIELLLSGAVVGTVCQKPSTMGALAVETMILALETVDFDQGLRFYDTPVVTADNQTAVCNPQW